MPWPTFGEASAVASLRPRAAVLRSCHPGIGLARGLSQYQDSLVVVACDVWVLGGKATLAQALQRFPEAPWLEECKCCRFMGYLLVSQDVGR